MYSYLHGFPRQLGHLPTRVRWIQQASKPEKWDFLNISRCKITRVTRKQRKFLSVDFLEIRLKKKIQKKADYQSKIEAQFSFNKTIIYIEEN